MSTELTYQMEPELRIGIPRSARVKAQAWAELRTIVLITLGVALVIGWFAARDLNDLYALRAHGITQQAVVTDTRKVHSKSDTYYIAYSLQTSSASIEDEDSVPQTLYEQKRRGDFVPVTFLAEQPQTHRLGRVGEERVWQRSIAWAEGLTGISGMLGLICAGIFYDYRKELRLAREGIPVPSVICDCVAPQPNAKTTEYTVIYQFTSPSGEQRQTHTISAEVGKRLVPGSKVTVLYDADNPRHSRLYCALRYTEVA